MVGANSTNFLSYLCCRHESELIEDIVTQILRKLTSTYSLFHKDLVGINSQMDELVK